MNKKRSNHNKLAQAAEWVNPWTPHAFVFISLCFLPLSSNAVDLSSASEAVTDGPQRYVKLSHRGVPVPTDASQVQKTKWDCVLDTKTGLVWEVKTETGLRGLQNIYTWFNPDSRTNGGTAGYRNGGKCSDSPCDTHSYTLAINQAALCGYRTWRLPSREELRSLVDYAIKPPRPMIDSRFFPHSAEQFYWSSTPDAGDADSAWGVGFALGFDYSYYKFGYGYIRLVTAYKR